MHLEVRLSRGEVLLGGPTTTTPKGKGLGSSLRMIKLVLGVEVTIREYHARPDGVCATIVERRGIKPQVVQRSKSKVLGKHNRLVGCSPPQLWVQKDLRHSFEVTVKWLVKL